jgi:protein phosphatase PTC7
MLKFNFISTIFNKAKLGSKGEDAFYASSSLLIVADGVGGWKLQGVDPSAYSTALVKNYVHLYEKEQQQRYNNINDMSIFVKACKLNQHIKGSSTFCSCRLHYNTLHTLNCGDSGYMLIRNGKAVWKSKHQQHSFNFPYQVGTNGDAPTTAVTTQHEQLCHNDKVVIATDGLWDNIHDNTIVDMVSNGLTAKSIGNICYKLSMNNRYLSPFSVGSNYRYIGGKPDDITIIVSTIISNNKL